MPDLKPLLSPDSVAIIGASADTETLRGRLTHALIGHGYDGRVSIPGVFMSTRNWARPCRRFSLVGGEVRNSAIMKSA